MNPQDPTIQPLNHQAPAPMAPPPPPPPAPLNPPLAPPPVHPEPHHAAPPAHPAAAEHAAPHIPQPHAHVGLTGHAPAAQAPDHLPHIAPVTAGNRPVLVTLSVAALFVSLLGTFILYFSNVATKSRIKTTETTISELQTKIDSPPLSVTNAKLEVINTALAGYNTAIGTKLKFQEFFERLPKKTPKDMRISALTIDAEGTVRITGTGTTFDTAGKSLMSFADLAGLSDVALENIGLSGGEGTKVVNFGLTGKLDTAKLLVNPAPSPSPSPSGDASTPAQ